MPGLVFFLWVVSLIYYTVCSRHGRQLLQLVPAHVDEELLWHHRFSRWRLPFSESSENNVIGVKCFEMYTYDIISDVSCRFVFHDFVAKMSRNGWKMQKYVSYVLIRPGVLRPTVHRVLVGLQGGVLYNRDEGRLCSRALGPNIMCSSILQRYYIHILM